MEIGLLGPLQVALGQGRTVVPSGRQCLLLAVLALNAGRVVSTDRLIEAVWGGDEPVRPANALQGRISKLRAALGRDLVVQQGPGYLLDVGAQAVDVHRFETLVDDGQRLLDAGELPAARAAFEQALSLWRGRALEGLTDAPWAVAEATRLEERRLSALEGRFSADLEAGQGAALVAELERLVADQPFRERFRAQLMLALYRSGRQVDALQVFAEGRDLLAEELGLDPAAELQELQARILEQDPALLLSAVDARDTAKMAEPAAGGAAANVATPPDPDTAAAGERIRVLVVDDDPLVRSALTSILHAEADLEVVDEAADGAAAVDLARALRPEVVLMDVRMPTMDGIEATRQLTDDPGDGSPRVIVLTTFEQDEHVYRALQAGASGFLLKRSDPQKLPDAVRTVARGDAIIDPAVTRALLHRFTAGLAEDAAASRPHESLTVDERRVFDLMARGLSDEQIGARLDVGVGTVAAHATRALDKLAVRDRTQAVVYAYQHGLVADA